VIRTLIAASALFAAPALADTAWVTNQSSDDVSVVDLESAKVVATIDVGGQPAGVAAAPDGRAVYIVSPGSKTISEIDPVSKTVKRRLVLDGGPLGIAVSPDSKTIYSADWYGSRLWVIDATTFEVSRTLPVGQSPSGIAVAPDGTVISADRDSDQISIINPQTSETVQVKVGERPFGVTIDAEGLRAYTADVGSNTVTVIDLETRKAVGSVPTGDRPYAVALAKGKGFATDQYDETITVFDLKTFEVIDTIDSGEYPEGIATTSDGERIVFANWFSNALWVVDAETLDVIHEIDVGDGPRAFGQFLTAD
jgi:YVTN family beta-propeller protein